MSAWIPVSEKLPENSKHKGAFCPKYLVFTKYGITIGWYSPDRQGWEILAWFMTSRYLEKVYKNKQYDFVVLYV